MTGLDREALTSLHTLFQNARAAHIAAGPAAASAVAPIADRPVSAQPASLGALVLFVVNAQLRPFVSYWHAELQQHEAARKPTQSAFEHEQAWPHHNDFCEDLSLLQQDLRELARHLEILLSLQPSLSLMLPPVLSRELSAGLLLLAHAWLLLAPYLGAVWSRVSTEPKQPHLKD